MIVSQKKGIQTEPTKYDAMIDKLRSMRDHRKAHPTIPSEELFYDILVKYHSSIRDAATSGRPVAVLGTAVPIEIFRAMDIAPLHMWWASGMVVPVLNLHREALDFAAAYGWTAEVCSGHRVLVAPHVKHWIAAPTMVVWATHTCDNCCKTGEMVARAWDIPYLFLERPRSGTERDAIHYSGQLRELVKFLEEQTGRKMDWDRLREMLKRSLEMQRLHEQTYELQKRVPSPAINRRIMQYHMVNRLYAGTPEGVDFMKCVLKETEEMVRKGTSHPERFRLLCLDIYPTYSRKLAEWMQAERGAVMVSDPFFSHWGPAKIDLSQPLESLARQYYAEPVSHSYFSTTVEDLIQPAVQDAREFRADGAIWWMSHSCVQSSGVAHIVKEALQKQAGIPTFIIDIERNDPTYVSDETLKANLDTFFEVLEGLKVKGQR